MTLASGIVQSPASTAYSMYVNRWESSCPGWQGLTLKSLPTDEKIKL